MCELSDSETIPLKDHFSVEQQLIFLEISLYLYEIK